MPMFRVSFLLSLFQIRADRSLVQPFYLLWSGFLFIVYDQRGHHYRWLVLSAVLTGLAVLTKGPVALLVTLLTAGTVFLLRRFRNFIPVKAIPAWLGVFAITGVIMAPDDGAQRPG
ncbi:MAG: hypothetical protein MZV64_71735 [Ignavibacteriales bacterium]|nr:hypothetical protein [Ignavibacteriales bacterium]